MNELLPTLVKKGATLGANSTIICGNTIGAYSFIGAGAVVTEDVPDFALITGNPGRVTGWMCKCGVRLKVEEDNTVCGACGLRYQLTEGRIRII
jgi:UDP-2-acetamido-3-amino-2,3-dideoxy-glucuronate N-acetyltransferase